MPVWAWVLLIGGGAGALALGAAVASQDETPSELYFTSEAEAFFYADQQLRAALEAQGITVPTGSSGPSSPYDLAQGGGTFGEAVSDIGQAVGGFVESLWPF